MNQKSNMSDDLRWVFGSFLRWAWLVVLLAVIGGGAAYLASRSMTPMYQASTVIMLSQPATYGTTNSDSLVTSEMLARTYSEVLLSRNILGSVAADLHLTDKLENLRRMVTVTPVRDTQLITITVEYPNRKLAADIANALALKFIAQNQESINGQVSANQDSALLKMKGVQQQITDIQNELAQQQKKTYTERSQFVTKMIADLQQEIIGLQQEIVALENDPTTVRNLDYYGRYVIVTVTPDVSRRKNLVVKSERVDELKSLLIRYQTEYASLSVNQQTLSNPDPTTDQLRSLLSMYQNVYITLQQDYANIGTAVMKSSLQISQVENAVAPITPISPNTIQNTLIGIAGGLFLALLMIYLIEPLEAHHTAPEIIAQRHNLPVLGGLFGNSRWTSFTGPDQANSRQVEAYHFLHVHLQQHGLQNEYRTILITSAVPGEDKEKVAANLALVIAQSGTKTCLVDLDLHDPNIHQYVRVGNQEGISDVLNDKRLSLDRVTRDLWENQLGLITSGSPVASPYALINSNRPGEVINELRGHWDVVILNTPPVLSFTDTLKIAGLVDGILLVARQGSKADVQLEQAINRLNQTGAKLMGLVLNGVSSRQLRKQFHFYKPHQRTASVTKKDTPVPSQVSQD